MRRHNPDGSRHPVIHFIAQLERIDRSTVCPVCRRYLRALDIVKGINQWN